MAIITVVLTAVCSIFVTCITLYYKEIFIPRTKNKYFNPHKANCYLELDRVCAEVKRELCVTACYIGFFHNGGTFINGISMDKFTVVAEARNESICSYKRRYQNVLVNIYSYAFHCLIVNNRYFIDDIDNHQCEDRSLIDDINMRHNKSLYMFLIKDPIKETPLGYIAIEGSDINLVNLNTESKIWKHQIKIAKLLNQTYI